MREVATRLLPLAFAGYVWLRFFAFDLILVSLLFFGFSWVLASAF